jgi:hypothetical protein
VDVTLGPDVHFATLLRRGRYHLQRTEERRWRLFSYTREE